MRDAASANTETPIKMDDREVDWEAGVAASLALLFCWRPACALAACATGAELSVE